MTLNRRLVLAPYAVAAVLIAAFLGSKAYSAHYWRTLSDASLNLVSTTLPSMEPLNDMRLELHRIVSFGHSDANAITPTQRLAIVQSARRRFNHAYQRYLRIPSHPGEALRAPAMTLALSRLDEALAEAMQDAKNNPRGEPSRDIVDLLRLSTEDVTRMVSQELAVTAREANEANAALNKARASTRQVSHILDAICILAGVAAAFAVAQLIRRHIDLAEHYVALQAERVNELEQFSHRVAHDILGPLQPVSLGLELLHKRTAADPDSQNLTQRSLGSLRRVQNIVEELLRFARSGARPEPGVHSSLPRVVEGIREDLTPAADQAGVQLIVQNIPDVTVACAEAGVTVMLQNLILNAIKYMGDGPNKQVITRAEVSELSVRLVVQDSGPGLPKGWEKTVFDPYVRAPGPKKPGMGLGLATVKRIAESHGGRVGVEPNLPHGSSFWVDLPRPTAISSSVRS